MSKVLDRAPERGGGSVGGGVDSLLEATCWLGRVDCQQEESWVTSRLVSGFSKHVAVGTSDESVT